MPLTYKRRRPFSFDMRQSKRFRPNPIGIGVSGLAQTAIPWAVAAGSAAYRYFSGGRKGGTTSGQGVTNQYDRKTVYYKKSMPRRKKRQWKKFVSKVNATLLKSYGTRTIVRNSQITYTDATDNQGRFAVCLYGKDGSDSGTSVGFGDLKDIFNNDPLLANPTAKALFASAILDLTITNNSTVTDESNNNTTVEMDIYEWTMSKKADANNLITVFNNGAANTSPINGANPQLTLSVRGTTPFDLPDALAQGVKILKKTKYLLSSRQCMTYQMRMARNKQFRKDVVDDGDDNFAIPWITRGLLIIVKGVPTGTPTSVLKSIQIGVTRKYCYKHLQANDDVDNLLP